MLFGSSAVFSSSHLHGAAKIVLHSKNMRKGWIGRISDNENHQESENHGYNASVIG